VERVRPSGQYAHTLAGSCFNEVAPGGASQATIETAVSHSKFASTKSLLVERVRPGDREAAVMGGIASTKSLLVERVRPKSRIYRAHCWVLQRSRSWWSESGVHQARLASAGTGFNEVAPGGASQARPPAAMLFTRM